MKIHNLCKIRSEAFKNQDHEMGAFDVVFDFNGKKLYSNKFMLLSISSTFASMISDRWTSKDQPIPIETYSYDDFYLFLTFLYSEECELTNDNIFIMVDMAEFYQVSDFKDACDEYLSKLGFNFENVFQLLEIASKYSMEKLKKSIAPFLSINRVKIFNAEKFLQISKEVLSQILELDQSALSSEYVFQKVYEWAEKIAMAKKNSVSNFNIDETIKETLSDFMPLFDFYKMNGCFVIKFVVRKSLLPSGPELSELLLDSCGQALPGILVEITDENGKIMKGQFCDPGNIYDEIQKFKNVVCHGNPYYIYWSTSHRYRPTQNILKKRDGIEWYLIYDKDNDLAVKHRTEIDDSKDYLIAKMFADNGFVLNRKCKIDCFFF